MRVKEIRDANNKGLKLLIFAESRRGFKSVPLVHVDQRGTDSWESRGWMVSIKVRRRL